MYVCASVLEMGCIRTGVKFKLYSIGSSRKVYYVEGKLENEVDSEKLFQDETNMGTKEEFTSEVKI